MDRAGAGEGIGPASPWLRAGRGCGIPVVEAGSRQRG